MNQQDLHEPDPEFTRYLEWQTRSELRRRQRFGSEPQSSSTNLPRVLRSAALVLFSLFSGAGIVVAAEHLKESREVEMLLERNRLRTELAGRRVEEATKLLEAARVGYQEGRQPQSVVLEAEERLAKFEQVRAQLALSREELQLANREVDRSLSAPLVAGRDFVSESQDLTRGELQQQLEAARKRQEATRIRVEAGLVTSLDLVAAEEATQRVLSDIDFLDRRAGLRAMFLKGGLDALECDRRERLLEVERRRDGFAQQLLGLETRLERKRALVEVGVVPQSEAMQLEGDRDAVLVELRLAEVELNYLRGSEGVSRGLRGIGYVEDKK